MTALEGQVVAYIPAWLAGHKLDLMRRVARTVSGSVQTVSELADLPKDAIPLICCAGELGDLVADWRTTGRPFLYWDRGYVRRLGGLWAPLSGDGHYRIHLNSFQMSRIGDVSSDRWDSLQVAVAPWRRGGRQIVVASTESSYWRLHKVDNWLDRTLEALRAVTDRPIVVRHKTATTPLADELSTAHCLVAHGSNAAIEAVILGCPVCVDQSSAAALVGLTDIAKIEDPICPERTPWLRSLAYSQFLQHEMLDKTLWKSIH